MQTFVVSLNPCGSHLELRSAHILRAETKEEAYDLVDAMYDGAVTIDVQLYNGRAPAGQIPTVTAGAIAHLRTVNAAISDALQEERMVAIRKSALQHTRGIVAGDYPISYDSHTPDDWKDSELDDSE